jgi:hypothetical protein
MLSLLFMSALLPPWPHASSSVHIIDSIHVTCLDVTCLIDESANPQAAARENPGESVGTNNVTCALL